MHMDLDRGCLPSVGGSSWSSSDAAQRGAAAAIECPGRQILEERGRLSVDTSTLTAGFDIEIPGPHAQGRCVRIHCVDRRRGGAAQASMIHVG
jgi:hypothetical protein